MANTGAIISIFLIIILLAAGVTFLVLYLVERNRKRDAPPKVGITGAKFSVKSDTEVEASWDSTQPNNQVTLYASTNPKSISIGTNGKPSAAEGVLNSATVNGTNVKSVNIKTGIVPETTYYLALVAFDVIADIVNDVVYTDTVLEGEFRIEDINGDSAINLESNQTTVTLVYNNIDKSTLDDVWEYDAGQFGEEATFTLFNKAISDEPQVVLYNNNGTLAAEGIQNLVNANTLPLAQWEYKDLKWCLKSDSSKCFTRAGTGNPTSVQVGAVSAATINTWKNKTVT